MPPHRPSEGSGGGGGGRRRSSVDFSTGGGGGSFGVNATTRLLDRASLLERTSGLDKVIRQNPTLSRLLLPTIDQGGPGGGGGDDGNGMAKHRSGSWAHIALEDRAMHPFFLQELVERGFDTGRVTWSTKDIASFTTGDVVNYIIKPATARESVDFVQAATRGDISLGWCTNGILQTPSAAGRPAYGATTYFVSHAWSYKFTDLVRLLMDHYRHLPGTEGDVYVDVYYWIDIFAVTQHFVGQFTDSMDSDFPHVIQGAKQLLCVALPRLPKPAIFSRVWCLYEILNAVNCEVDIELLMDEMKSVAETSAFDKLDIAVQQWDVRDARATVQVDYLYIMNCITQSPGIEQFNLILQSRMRDSMLTAQLKMAVERGYHETALHLIEKRGAKYAFVHEHFHFERQPTDELLERISKEAKDKAGGWHRGCGRKKEQPMLTVPAGDLAARVLAEMMLDNATITSVSLRGLSDEGLSALAKAVSTHQSRLRRAIWAHLDLSQNVLGVAGAAALGLILQHMPTIKSLDLRDTKSSSLHQPLTHGIPLPPPRLKVATSNGILGGGVRAFAAGVAVAKSLKELRLDHSGLDAEGAVGLAEAIATGQAPLSLLVLDGNLIMDDGAAAMANALIRNRSLVNISLNGCGVGHVGATALAKALLANAGIVSVRLSNNAAVGDVGVAALSKAIHSGSGRLHTLHLNNVSMSVKSSMMLADALSGPGGGGIKDLDVADNFDLGPKARQHFKKMSRMKDMIVVCDDMSSGI